MSEQTVQVIALTPVKSGGVLRVPGTDTERFEVSLPVYESLKHLKAVRAASEVPESPQASANTGADTESLVEQLNQAEGFLRHAGAVNDELSAQIQNLQTQVSELQAANGELQASVDKANATLASAKPVGDGADASAQASQPSKASKGARS